MIILIHGDEEFLRAEALAEVKAALGPPEFAQLNTLTLDGARFTLADLHHGCDVAPFLAPRRLVILDGALTAWARKSARGQAKNRPEATPADGQTETGDAAPEAVKQMRTALIAYLPRIPETTDLVLLEPAQVRKTEPLYKALEALAGVRMIVCQYEGPWWKQDEWLLHWLTQRAKQRKIKIEPAALQTLMELAGRHLRLLDQELSKLLAFTANERPISAADIRLLVSGAREHTVFEMVEALANGNGQQAIVLLQTLLDAGEQPLAILGMIAWQYRLLLQVKDLMTRGLDQDAAGVTLGQKPFTMKKTWPQAQRFSLRTLEWALERLLESDVAIKTGQMEDRTVLLTLVAELAAPQKTAGVSSPATATKGAATGGRSR